MSTAKIIITQLGTRQIATRMKVGLSAVYANCDRGSFPASWFVPLTLMGLEKGVSVPVSLFRWRSVDADSLQNCQCDFHVSGAAGGS